MFTPCSLPGKGGGASWEEGGAPVTCLLPSLVLMTIPSSFHSSPKLRVARTLTAADKISPYSSIRLPALSARRRVETDFSTPGGLFIDSREVPGSSIPCMPSPGLGVLLLSPRHATVQPDPLPWGFSPLQGAPMDSSLSCHHLQPPVLRKGLHSTAPSLGFLRHESGTNRGPPTSGNPPQSSPVRFPGELLTKPGLQGRTLKWT